MPSWSVNDMPCGNSLSSACPSSSSCIVAATSSFRGGSASRSVPCPHPMGVEKIGDVGKQELKIATVRTREKVKAIGRSAFFPNNETMFIAADSSLLLGWLPGASYTLRPVESHARRGLKTNSPVNVMAAAIDTATAKEVLQVE